MADPVATGFAWLNEVMLWLGRWVPRLLLIKLGYRGVKFGPGGSIGELDPGLHVYWPITHDVTVVSVMPRTFEICAQTHGHEAIAVAVGYQVTSPALSLTQVNDLRSNLDDRTQAALAAHVHPDKQTLVDAMLVDLREQFAPAGVEIQWCSVIQRGPVFTLKNIQDWAKHEPETA